MVVSYRANLGTISASKFHRMYFHRLCAKSLSEVEAMHFDLKQSSRLAVAVVFATIFALPQNLVAEATHVVSPSELQQAVIKASTTRQHNLDEVQQFFSSE